MISENFSLRNTVYHAGEELHYRRIPFSEGEPIILRDDFITDCYKIWPTNFLIEINNAFRCLDQLIKYQFNQAIV